LRTALAPLRRDCERNCAPKDNVFIYKSYLPAPGIAPEGQPFNSKSDVTDELL
jgi:hypothetical protein